MAYGIDAMEPPQGEAAHDLPPSDAFWSDYLERGEGRSRFQRHLFSALPSEPRCRLCTAPFGGIGGPVMRAIGRSPSESTPLMCTACRNALAKYHGGAETTGTMLFADIRGSTALAESMAPAAFKALLERFYRIATRAVIDHEGTIDKFVGDELMAMFWPALAGGGHPAKAVLAAQHILRGTGHGEVAGPWLPVGAGVHTGRVWFGAVGEGSRVDITALGDVVNTTARLAAAAGAGEILVSAKAAAAAGLPANELEHRALTLKGKELPFEVMVANVATPAAG
jgi:adenylate cyclase